MGDTTGGNSVHHLNEMKLYSDTRAPREGVKPAKGLLSLIQ